MRTVCHPSGVASQLSLTKRLCAASCSNPDESRSYRAGGAQTPILLDMLNTPVAVLAVIVVLVALNSLLFFGYYLPRTNTAPASSPRTERTTGATTSERTHPTTTVEETRPERTHPKET